MSESRLGLKVQQAALALRKKKGEITDNALASERQDIFKILRMFHLRISFLTVSHSLFPINPALKEQCYLLLL